MGGGCFSSVIESKFARIHKHPDRFFDDGFRFRVARQMGHEFPAFGFAGQAREHGQEHPVSTEPYSTEDRNRGPRQLPMADCETTST